MSHTALPLLIIAALLFQKKKQAQPVVAAPQQQDLVDVYIFPMTKSKDAAAKGFFITRSDSRTCCGYPLGRGYCEVFVTVVRNKDEPLYLDIEGFKTWGDTLKKAIPWPESLVAKLKVVQPARMT